MSERRQRLAGRGGGTFIGPRRRRRGIGVLPSLFTLGNCLCGFSALHYASLPRVSPNATQPAVSHFAIAGYFIFGAMVFDMFDGFVARLARATSDFGAELDSLADMVSFGVAPAFLSLHVISELLAKSYAPPGTTDDPYAAFMGPWADSVVGKLFWIVGAIYVSCAALRLARFNVFNKHDVESHQVFRGLPSPGAAGVVASSILFFETLYADRHYLPFNVPEHVQERFRMVFPYLIPVMLLASALLMVSRFPYAHLINRFFRGRRRFNYIVVVFLMVMLLLWQPQITVLLGIYVYAASAPATWLWRLVFKKGPPAAVPGTVKEIAS